MIAEIVAGLAFVFGIVVVFALLIAALTCLRAFVLCKLWTWFVVPLFHFPELTIPFAIGLSLVMGMFHSHTVPDDNKTQFWSMALAGPLIVLLIGWIVKMFI